MNDWWDRRIEAALRRESERLAGGPGFGPDQVVRAGRAAVRRRRAGGVAAVAVAVALTVTGVYTVLPGGVPDAPPVAPAGTASPTPPVTGSSAPPGGVPIAGYGLAAYAGNVIWPPDGDPLTLPFPADRVSSVNRVPAAWVVETADGLWWVPDDGEPREIGDLSSPVFAGDGSMLVASLTGAAATAVAVALPLLVERGRTRFDSGMGPLATGVAGDLVLLRGAQGGPGPSATAVWDLSAGTLTPVGDQSVWAWAVAGDGTVLRRVDEPGTDPKDIRWACVDAVPLSVPLPVEGTGLCGREAAALHGGDLSPDGKWVYLYSGDQDTLPGHFLLATADLRAGRWAPIELDRDAGPPVWWDTDRTYLAGDLSGGFSRCDTTGACQRLAMPVPDARPVPVHGG